MKKIGALLLLLVPLVLAGCTKEVTDYDLTIVDDTITYTGKYTGTLEDGNAVGEAKYVVKIDDTSNWVYQGTFVDGKISGGGSVDKYPCTIRI